MTGEHKGDGYLERVPIELIHPNPFNPRRNVGESGIEGLAESIQEVGMQSPILLSRHLYIEGEYYIVGGERRWRAAQVAGWHSVQCKIYKEQLNEPQLASNAYIENVKRKDMNPMDIALSFQNFVASKEEGGFGMTIEKAAKMNGEPRSKVNNYLRLLKLPPKVQSLIEAGALSFSLARHIAGLPQQFQERMALAAVKSNWSVDQLVKNTSYISSIGKKGKRKLKNEDNSADIKTVERVLSEVVGTNTSVKMRAGKIKLEMTFHSVDEFQGYMEKFDIDIDELDSADASNSSSGSL